MSKLISFVVASIITSLFMTTTTTSAHAISSDTGSGVTIASFTCSILVKVGILNSSGGWETSIFGGQRDAKFTGASVDPSTGMLACEYDGLYMLVRPAPKGHRCSRTPFAGSRDFECTPVKPPPVKIPGKKTTN